MKIALRIAAALIALALVFFGYHAIRAGSIIPGDIWGGITGAASEPDPQPGILPGARPDFVSLPALRAHVDVNGDVVTVKQEMRLDEARGEFVGWLNSMQFAATRVLGVSSPGGISSFGMTGMTLTVRFARPSDSVTLEYELTLPHKIEMLGWSERQVLLCNFLLTPQVERDGQPLSPYVSAFGDPYVYEARNYEVEVTADAAYTMLAAGKTEENTADGRTTAIFCGSGLRDFSIVLMKDFELTVTQAGGINVYYADAALAQPFVENALRFASDNIGEYPYRDLFVIAAPISRNHGMELSNMILLMPDSFLSLDALKPLCYHEVFHQWFYLLIGTDQINEPFVDEGMATFLTNQLCLVDTPTAYNPAFIGKAIGDYASKTDYQAGAYTQSARYVSSLFDSVGEEGFYAALKRMYKEQTGKIMYYDDFKSYFQR